MLRERKPRVSLPHQVQDEQERTRKIIFEEDGHVEIGTADGVEGDVELGNEADEVHDGADVGAVDSEGGAEGELVECMAGSCSVFVSILSHTES